MHKTCKYHKLEFTTELIFCSNPKSSLKIKEAFWPGNQGDADFWVSLQEYVIPATFYLTCQFQSDCTSLFSGWNQFVLNWCTRPNWQSTCETSRHTPLCFLCIHVFWSGHQHTWLATATWWWVAFLPSWFRFKFFATASCFFFPFFGTLSGLHRCTLNTLPALKWMGGVLFFSATPDSLTEWGLL